MQFFSVIRKQFLFLPLLTFSNLIFALNLGTPNVPVDKSGTGDGYTAVLYDNTKGLPTSEANSIATTSEGFIWIGSYAGLIRYDGCTFERMDSSYGISSVVALFVDSKDRLWVGTNDSGIVLIDKGSTRRFNWEQGLKTLYVRTIAEDWEGNIYVGTTRGIYYINPDFTVHEIRSPYLEKENIRSLRFNGDGLIYGVTSTGAVFTLKQKTVTRFYDSKQLGISSVRTICPDPKNHGYYFLGTIGAEVFYGKLTDTFEISEKIAINPLKYVNDLIVYNGFLWICTDEGIGYFYDDKFYTIASTPLNTSVETMMHDYQGNLWFASSQLGIMKIVPNPFSNLFEKYHLESEVVYSTCLFNDSLFIGTKNSGLIVIKDDKIVTSLPIKKSQTASGLICSDKDLIEMLKNQRVRSIVKDKKNRLWISTYSNHGVICYHDGYVTKYSTDDGLPNNRCRVVVECTDGSYIVCCSRGLSLIQDDKIVKTYGSDVLINSDVLTATQMDNGDILIGTDGGGIYILRNGEITHLSTDGDPLSGVILRLKRDLTRDIIWIVTSNCIAYMGEDLRVHIVKDFPYTNNFDLYENSKGEMWVLSSNGIYVADVNQILANQKINPIHYTRDNGLSCIATANSYSERAPNGDLFISGTTGVARVNIEKPFESVSNIKMGVPYVDADGHKIFPNKNGGFTVPNDTRKVSVHSHVFNYSLINPEVSFRLDGFDRAEVNLRRTDLKPINYTNLHGGDYNFIMKIFDPHGNSSKEMSISIIKEKSFLELLGVRIAICLLILIIIGLCVKFYIDERTRHFKQEESKQKQLIREIVTAFSRVIDMKDKYTRGHSSRVAKYTAMLTRELGYDKTVVEEYYNIAMLHDIGKVGVPPEVLNKAGKLTDEEFNIIKSHSSLGYETLKDISIMPELAIGAGFHHERPDGKGYPKGLKGDEIPRVAQIIAVADTFDAMYSDRPYRQRMNFDRAVSIIKEVRGTQLTADVVDAFLRLVEKGKFRLPSDKGGGTMEDINNIRKKFENEE